MSIGYDAEGYDIELDNQDCGKCLEKIIRTAKVFQGN